MAIDLAELLEAAERLLRTFDTEAPRARTEADISGGGERLGGLVDALLRTSWSTVLKQPGAREQLEASAPALAARVRAQLEWPLRHEARLRAGVASLALEVGVGQRKEGIARVMERWRSRDPDERRAARRALDPALDEAAKAGDLPGLARSIEAAPAEVEPEPEPPPAERTTAGGLILPSAELVAMLTAPPVGLDQGVLGGRPGATGRKVRGRGTSAGLSTEGLELMQDAQNGAGMEYGATGVEGDQALGAEVEGTRAAVGSSGISMTSEPAQAARAGQAKDGGLAQTPGPEFLDFTRALAESASGELPKTFGAWRAARAGRTVADFRSAELPLLSAARGAIGLPSEQPMVPLGRPGALDAGGLDATAAIARLTGLGATIGAPALGMALALGTPARVYIERGLADPPGDRARARRILALELALSFMEAAISARAAGSAETLQELGAAALGCAPPKAFARWWALERGLARAPGEETALYRHGGETTVRAWLRAVTTARALRDEWDDDWFRNPRATLDRVRDTAIRAEPADPSEMSAWLREVTG